MLGPLSLASLLPTLVPLFGLPLNAIFTEALHGIGALDIKRKPTFAKVVAESLDFIG